MRPSSLQGRTSGDSRNNIPLKAPGARCKNSHTIHRSRNEQNTGQTAKLTSHNQKTERPGPTRDIQQNMSYCLQMQALIRQENCIILLPTYPMQPHQGANTGRKQIFANERKLSSLPGSTSGDGLNTNDCTKRNTISANIPDGRELNSPFF